MEPLIPYPTRFGDRTVHDSAGADGGEVPPHFFFFLTNGETGTIADATFVVTCFLPLLSLRDDDIIGEGR